MIKRVFNSERPIYDPQGSTQAIIADKISLRNNKNTPKSKSTPTYPLKGDGEVGVKIAKVDELINLAGNLTRADKKRLLDCLALDVQVSEKLNADRDFEMWFIAITQALDAHGDSSDGSAHAPLVLKRMLGIPSNWTPIRDFMKESRLNELKAIERQSVYNMLAKLLLEHVRYVARKSGAPFTAKLIASCANAISGVFDSAFPGYIEAGLAHVVARRLGSNV